MADKPAKKKPSKARYRVERSLTYSTVAGTVTREAGDITEDLPERSRKWLVAKGFVTKIGGSDDA